MSKTTKIWLIIGTSLVLIGCIIFGGVMTMLKWDFTKLSTGKYETNHYEITENFKSISIITNTADVVFLSSENSKTSISCYQQRNAKHFVAVKDGVLVIKIVDTRKWYEHIGINFSTPKITVYIPQGEYGKLSVKANTSNVEIPEVFKFTSVDISVSTGDVKNYASALEDVKIKTTTGDICIEDASAGSLDLTVSTGKVTVFGVTCENDTSVGVSTGKVYLTDLECKNFSSNGNTGDISFKNVIAKEKFFIKRTTGDIKLNSCDAAELFIKTDTGDVKGSLLTSKVFITKTDTGKIDLPKTTSGGLCEVETDTGDIIIEIKK